MADNDKKPVIALVPAILTGTAALIAALTTVYINVRDDKQSDPAKPAVAAAAKPVPATAAYDRVHLQIERIAVQHDGSVGTTDWRFAIEADGEPLFAFEQGDLNDEGGRNIIRPDDAGAILRSDGRRPVKLVIKGWRGSRFRLAPGEPDVRGEGVLGAGAGVAAIQAVAAEPGDGAFTLYFSAKPAKDD